MFKVAVSQDYFGIFSVTCVEAGACKQIVPCDLCGGRIMYAECTL